MSNYCDQFLKEYERIAYACLKECSLLNGLSDYLVSMEKKMKGNAQLAENWKDIYNRLMHLQSLHTQLIENPDTIVITKMDVNDLVSFADSIWEGTDPLAMYDIADPKKQKKPLTDWQLFYRIAVLVIVSIAILVFICFKIF